MPAAALCTGTGRGTKSCARRLASSTSRALATPPPAPPPLAVTSIGPRASSFALSSAARLALAASTFATSACRSACAFRRAASLRCGALRRCSTHIQHSHVLLLFACPRSTHEGRARAWARGRSGAVAACAACGSLSVGALSRPSVRGWGACVPHGAPGEHRGPTGGSAGSADSAGSRARKGAREEHAKERVPSGSRRGRSWRRCSRRRT